MTTATICAPGYPTPHRAGVLARIAATAALWRHRMRERDALHLLDERDLRDAGMTRADMEFERAKPFWRA